jgi:hypothetical protein
VKAMGLAWGAVVVMAYGAAAEAAPNAAAPQVGAAGAAATTPSTVPTAPAPSPTPVPDAPSALDAAPPAPDTTTPASPPADDGNAVAEEQEEQDEEPPRRKRADRRRARVLVAEPTEDEPEAPEEAEVAPSPVASFHLAGPHFLLSVERITNLLSWSVTQTEEVTDFNSEFGAAATTLELERSGTDVSFLGSGGASTNVFSIPRVAFDGMFGNGFTLGGSLSYMVVSGKHEISTGGANKRGLDDGSASIFVFAPRIGVMIPASPFVGVWLRGGVSRISISRDVHPFDGQSGQQLASTVTSTLTLVDITLDPQLVLSPVPHVGITLGALLDIGVSGTAEVSGSTTTQDVKASSYGVTGGLVAIF